ncbi:MAG TPA: glycosyltransferase [Anaerohalosphaeraceae bacterium]|mgnify:FL=1|nr:glycosyltransferase [Anaerohalosphaeraceae bacterium]HPO70517.1 glycosyltransferase [Anaerohalosphaeraceae bacterium]
MKIAFVVSRFPTLTESFVVQQIAAMIERNWDAAVWAFAESQQTEIQKEVKEYGLLNKTVYLSMPSAKTALRLKGVFWLVASLLLSPKNASSLLYSFIKDRSFSYQTLLLLYAYLKGKPDVVHAHFGPNAIPFLGLKKTGLNLKLITSFHGYDVSVYTRRQGEHVYDELFLYGDIFTYNSESTRQKLLNLGCPEGKMIKLPMAVEVEKIPFKERFLNPSDKIRLLSVGRLVEMKGREYALKAAAKLKDKYPLQYDIVGDGPLRPDLEKLAADLGLGSSVKFWGWTSSEALTDLYDQAHLFVHPSITSSDGNQEGQGMVLLEAQACGIPVVATKHGAFPDSVIDGRTGFLVPEKDADALAERLDFLISSPHLWPQMGRLGRRFVQDNFDSKILNNRLEDIYRRLVQAKQSQ